MKKTEEFDGLTVHGLIADDDFVRWVRYPDEKSEHRWNLVSGQDEASARIVAEARELVKAVNIRVDRPSAHIKARVFERVKTEISGDESRPVVRRLWATPLLRVAAGLLLVSVVGLWLYLGKQDVSSPTDEMSLNTNADTHGGVIYLSDGRTLSFGDLALGVASEFEGATITKQDGNRLVYEASGNEKRASNVSGVKSPAGAVWEVALPDGSTASLNAQSTLRFASDAFGEVRQVSLDGEAYFEVTHDASRPFTVEMGEVAVTVLGTNFVASGYENAKYVDVSLVAGSVQVKHGRGEAVVIAPGQQARYNDGDVKPQVADVNLEQALAWKNGLFSFENESVDIVMQVLSRWYGVGVKYQGAKPNKEITGTIPNESALQDVLAILRDTGVDAQLSLEGNNVVVSTE